MSRYTRKAIDTGGKLTANIDKGLEEQEKTPRINLVVDQDNYNFIRIMSKISGQSMTRYINQIFEEYRTEHAEIYDKAVEVMRAAGMLEGEK